MLETIRIADSHGKILGYVTKDTFLSARTVEDAMGRLEKLEGERKALIHVLRATQNYIKQFPAVNCLELQHNIDWALQLLTLDK